MSDRLTVWLDGWQFQCCGALFAVGSQVRWTLAGDVDNEFADAVLGEALAATVTHHEEHHAGLPDDAPSTSATVRSIRTVHCVYGPRDESRVLYPIPGTGVLAWKESADRWETETDTLRFVGWLVELDTSD